MPVHPSHFMGQVFLRSRAISLLGETFNHRQHFISFNRTEQRQSETATSDILLPLSKILSRGRISGSSCLPKSSG
jgi:hypothetical protein